MASQDLFLGSMKEEMKFYVNVARIREEPSRILDHGANFRFPNTYTLVTAPYESLCRNMGADLGVRRL
jgi:hypothetical protein